MLNDEKTQAKIMHSLLLENVAIDAYEAVFFPGGHGAMWDLPEDTDVRLLLEAAHLAGKVIAAVCHCSAGLLSAAGKDGESILAGRRVNAFTDAEEEAAGLAGVVPFALESRMRELGGCFEKANNWQVHAVRDGTLITGQSPASSEMVARLVIAALNESA